MSTDTDLLQAATRAQLDAVSRALLRLHKALLDDERVIYEMANGAISSPHELFGLVLNHAQFTWLGKISSLIALLDEATSLRRPATENAAQSLLAEAKSLLTYEIEDREFVTRLQRVVQRSPVAKSLYEEALQLVTNAN